MIQSAQVPRSRVIHLGSDSSRCGYCRRSDGSHNYALWALRLHVEDYQQLLDAGWRRSGNYLYRPQLHNTCCPPYVIRLEASTFKPSSTHKRVLKRLRHASTSRSITAPHVHKGKRKQPQPPHTQLQSTDAQHRVEIVRAAITDAAHTLVQASELSAALRMDQIHDSLAKFKLFPPRQQAKRSTASPTRTDRDRGASTHAENSESLRRRDKVPNVVSNVALVLAAAERRSNPTSSSPHVPPTNVKPKGDDPPKRQMSLANALQRILVRNQSVCNIAAVGVTYPGFLNFWWNPPEGTSPGNTIEASKSGELAHSSDTLFHVKQVQPLPSLSQHQWRAKSQSALRSIDVSDVSELDVMGDVEQGQTSNPSHNSSASFQTQAKQQSPQSQDLPNVSSFSMQMVPSDFRDESYELFRRYQMLIHHERASQCTKDIYTRFLVDSPLTRHQSALNSEEKYGSYHFLYRINGRLFAVGVVDVLPRCLSSVYLFYDPDFARLSPGTLSALKEIEWINSVSHTYPSLRHYYMGYYIHSCPKMRYKASFCPSELLCEVSKNWVPVVEARQVLENVGERALRLAPPQVPPAPGASNFQFDDEELRQLSDEAILHVGKADDEVMQMLSFKSLREAIGSRYPEQVSTIRNSIEAFLRHVGKRNAMYYLHML